MSKIVLGLLVGAVLGCLDGLTAWFTPDVRAQLLGIVIGSTGKGLIAGFVAGWVGRRYNSMTAAVLTGLGVGLVLSYIVAALPGPNEPHYYLQIMLPGSILGLIAGFPKRWLAKPAIRPSIEPGSMICR